MSGASTSSPTRRTSSSMPGADDDSTTWSVTSAVEGDCPPTASGRMTEIPGSCSSVGKSVLAAGPLSRIRRPAGWCPLRLIDGLRERAADLAVCCVRGQAASEDRMERLQAGLAAAWRLGGPQREEPGAHLHPPAHRLCLPVGNHDRRGKLLV